MTLRELHKKLGEIVAEAEVSNVRDIRNAVDNEVVIRVLQRPPEKRYVYAKVDEGSAMLAGDRYILDLVSES